MVIRTGRITLSSSTDFLSMRLNCSLIYSDFTETRKVIRMAKYATTVYTCGCVTRLTFVGEETVNQESLICETCAKDGKNHA